MYCDVALFDANGIHIATFSRQLVKMENVTIIEHTERFFVLTGIKFVDSKPRVSFFEVEKPMVI